jgi:nucleotide-binding universal stress UspA family protein
MSQLSQPHATSAVATAGAAAVPADPDRPRRLMLATDLSPASDAATAMAVAMAIRHEAELVVLSVIDPRRLRLAGGRFLRRMDQERERVESSVQGVVQRARSAGARATFLVWEGEPAETIVAASEAEAIDIIVVGSHGRGRLARLLLGSTSGQVAEDAPRPVIVVPAE